MQKNLLKKSLVLGIIILFLLTSITALSAEVVSTAVYNKQMNSRHIFDILQKYKSKEPMRPNQEGVGTIQGNSQSGDTTLISILLGVIEVDYNGNIVWEMAECLGPFDVERLSNGNTLITDTDQSRLIEVDYYGNIVWEKTGLDGPVDAERLTNGNTLITDNEEGRVIEVDTQGDIVWEKTGLDRPGDAERLSNGNTLITERLRVIEVDTQGDIVWEKTGLEASQDAERLPNGNTLITDLSDGGRVIEVDYYGNIVWEKTGLDGPNDAERLSNGNTLIIEFNWDAMYGRVIEVDYNGNIVWEKTGYEIDAPMMDAERLSNKPPNKPTITGQTSGKPGTEYEYTFNAVDPNGDNVKYHIDWDDGDSDTTAFSSPGTNVKVKHTWITQGTYIIKAIAEDTNGLVGPEGTLSVTMPRNRASYTSYLLKLLEQFPFLERLFNLIL